MAEEKDKQEHGRIVYSRLSVGDEDGGDGAAPESVEPSAARGGDSPASRPVTKATAERPASLTWTLVPLITGFALLIGLVIGLGYLSKQQLKRVSGRALDMEQRNAARVRVLLGLNAELIRLNTEARARADAESRGGLKPPLELQLRGARRDVNESLKLYDRLPLAQTDRGKIFLTRVTEFLSATEDLDRFSLEGFPMMRDIEKDLNGFLSEASKEGVAISRYREDAQDEALDKINLLTWFAVVVGLVVAAGTIFEVLRRFRQIRKSLDELRRERLFSTQMLEGTVSAVAAIDSHGRIRSANAAFFEVFPQASIDVSIHAQIATPEGMKLIAAATATRVERSTYRGRWRLEHGAQGVERVFDVYSSPLEIDGAQGQILSLVDATEAAEAEAELRRQESLAAVGQAAAQVAHEIKNPLGSIRLGVTMLRDMIDDREALTTIDLVERGIDHLNKLTLDVTQFSRRRKLTLASVALHELLDASLDLIADKIQEKNTPVEKNYNGESINIECDADQLRQVFVNLFANAVDAAPGESPVSITTALIKVERTSDRANGGARSAPFARIAIADRGEGMDAATRARIFEPFFTTKKRGTGLGLAIAKQIIEQHGGRITVESAPGRGTRFLVDLPLNPADI